MALRRTRRWSSSPDSGLHAGHRDQRDRLLQPADFESMGFTGDSAPLGLPALVQVAGLIAVFRLGRPGRIGYRRPVLLTGIGIMVAGQRRAGRDHFSMGDHFGGALRGPGFIGLVLFTVGFTFGFGAPGLGLRGGGFPARLRSIGASAMLTANLTANAVVAAVFLTTELRFGGAGPSSCSDCSPRRSLRAQDCPGDQGSPAGGTSGTTGRTAQWVDEGPGGTNERPGDKSVPRARHRRVEDPRRAGRRRPPASGRGGSAAPTSLRSGS